MVNVGLMLVLRRCDVRDSKRGREGGDQEDGYNERCWNGGGDGTVVIAATATIGLGARA